MCCLSDPTPLPNPADEWDGSARFASDYFDRLHELATALIADGKAFVCSLPAPIALEQRGGPNAPGVPSPYRGRSVMENLQLWREMTAGAYPDGSYVLRAKIDPPTVRAPMASPNLRMRDPVMYRIRHQPPHPRVASGELARSWCIYPTYDWAHCMSDAIEGVTHSLCTLEFVDHAEIYDWFVQNAPPVSVPAGPGGVAQGSRVSVPRQTEYGRLNLAHTVTSKRKLAALVASGAVEGWDDPRMPTLAGLRRRGYPAAALRSFCARVGVARVAGATVEPSMLEGCVREALEDSSSTGNPAPRAMAVLNPLPVTIHSLAEGEEMALSLPHHPEHEAMGRRSVPLTREIFIDRGVKMPPSPSCHHRRRLTACLVAGDFLSDEAAAAAPGGFRRLTPSQPVRLRGAYVVHVQEVELEPGTGKVRRLHCVHDAQVSSLPSRRGSL